jgi:hypothetical protein
MHSTVAGLLQHADVALTLSMHYHTVYAAAAFWRVVFQLPMIAMRREAAGQRPQASINQASKQATAGPMVT